MRRRRNPAGHSQIPDFGITLLGREEPIRAPDGFAKDDKHRVCVPSGTRGRDWHKRDPS
jgi:hypothetical protein